MKKWGFIPVIIMMLILAGCGGTETQNEQGEENQGMESQSMESQSADASKESQGAPIAETVRANLLQALEELEQGNVEKGSELIKQSIALVYPEGQTPPPIEESETEAQAKEGEVAPVAQMVRDRIQGAIEQFEAGDAEAGVKLLQEALSLIK